MVLLGKTIVLQLKWTYFYVCSFQCFVFCTSNSFSSDCQQPENGDTSDSHFALLNFIRKASYRKNTCVALSRWINESSWKSSTLQFVPKKGILLVVVLAASGVTRRYSVAVSPLLLHPKHSPVADKPINAVLLIAGIHSVLIKGHHIYLLLAIDCHCKRTRTTGNSSLSSPLTFAVSCTVKWKGRCCWRQSWSMRAEPFH